MKRLKWRPKQHWRVRLACRLLVPLACPPDERVMFARVLLAEATSMPENPEKRIVVKRVPR